MNPKLSGAQSAMLKALSAAEQDVLVELWELDFRPFGGEQIRLCNQTNETGGAVVWQGHEYQPYPVEASGFEASAQGAENRPTVRVSNVMGLVTAAAEQFNQLAGVPVVRRQTYARFLDAVNFSDGNPNADPVQEAVSRYLVERLSELTAESASLELAAPSESDGSAVPARIMLANLCVWQYRGGKDGLQEGCPYRGRPVADRFDMPTDDAAKDACSGTVLGCQARFGLTAVLPISAFPSCDKVNT